MSEITTPATTSQPSTDAFDDAIRQAGSDRQHTAPWLPTQRSQALERAPERPVEEQQVKMRSEHLNVYYGSNHAIRNVSLGVAANEVTALIGPSGCGKSTFLRALNRMHDLTPIARVEGAILLDDQNINKPGIDLVK